MTYAYWKLPELASLSDSEKKEVFEAFLRHHGYIRGLPTFLIVMIFPLILITVVFEVAGVSDHLPTGFSFGASFFVIVVLLGSILLATHVYLESLRPHLEKFLSTSENHGLTSESSEPPTRPESKPK